MKLFDENNEIYCVCPESFYVDISTDECNKCDLACTKCTEYSTCQQCMDPPFKLSKYTYYAEFLFIILQIICKL